MTPENYSKLVKEKTPDSKVFSNCIKAFLIGGIICTFGEVLMNFYQYIGLNADDSGTAVSITLILISAVLTGFDIYPKIAKFGGAGALVPITGFANAVASPAIESKTEGIVTGTGSKIFTISGPVILFGTISSVAVGIIYLCMSLA